MNYIQRIMHEIFTEDAILMAAYNGISDRAWPEKVHPIGWSNEEQYNFVMRYFNREVKTYTRENKLIFRKKIRNWYDNKHMASKWFDDENELEPIEWWAYQDLNYDSW